MAKYILAVYDACQVYLERFLNYAGARNSFGFTVKGYTDLTILAQDVQDNRIDAVKNINESCGAFPPSAP